MSNALPSAEVADDYKNSLEDLVSNDRYQIGNLTVIAKENIEHGEAIARVVRNHIHKVPPSRKLPALYVLDSIAKNVGTPYTIFFGKELYNIFMNAYTLVDGNIRKKLDEMLKTWREPVPGSLSTTPVFNQGYTQPIVDALNRARSAAQQARPQNGPLLGSRVAIAQAQPYPNTPTPPQGLQSYPRPGMPTYGPPRTNGHTTPYQQPPQPLPAYAPQQLPQHQPLYHTQQQPVQARYQTPPPAYSNPRPSPVDLATLHRDIDDLIVNAKIECASHPMDQNARMKLASLQTLKNYLETKQMSESDLLDVRRSVSEQMSQQVIPGRTPPVPPVQTVSVQQPVVSLPLSYPVQQPQVPPSILSAASSFLSTTNLAELIRMTANRNQPTPPPTALPFQLPQAPAPTPVQNAATVPPAEIPLIAQLRASGLISSTQAPPAVATSLSYHPPLGLANSRPPTNLPNSQSVEVTFTSASIKIPRPHLVQSLFTTRPNVCSTCGRRFTSDETGKEKKARHLDWHFRTKTRMIEAERRGQNRSWYVDEREWIASREYEDDSGPTESNANGSLVTPAKKKVKDWVKVPNDPVAKSRPCPIDQEVFEMVWDDDEQEFIWKDAIEVAGRIYHFSCYQAMKKDRERETGGTTPMGAGLGVGAVRGSTPDSILGKRKAEEETNGAKARIKLES